MWVGQDSQARHGHEHDRAAPDGPLHRPGSDGERLLQRRLGTTDRAQRFYDEQVLDHLNERMQEFVQRQEMFFLATADASGECDNSFRAGPAGFLQVLGESTLAFPEYRGNGVHASLGNIYENPHVGLLLIDFTMARIGLHINGRATVIEDEEMRAWYPHLPEDPVPGRRAQMWVHVEVQEAYIHCAKHIPQMQKAPRRTARDWGTDDYKRKGGDFFGAARDARERAARGDLGGAREHVPAPGPADLGPGPAPSAPARGVPAAEPSIPPSPAADPHLSSGTSASSSATQAPASASEDASAAPGASSMTLSVYGGPTAGALEDTVPEQRRSPESEAAPEPVSQARESRLPANSWPEAMPPRRLSESSLYTEEESSTAAGRPARTGPDQPGRTAMDGASGALAARGAASAGFTMDGSDPQAWREEAERALQEAQRRGQVSETSSFQGWFG